MWNQTQCVPEKCVCVCVCVCVFAGDPLGVWGAAAAGGAGAVGERHADGDGHPDGQGGAQAAARHRQGEGSLAQLHCS